MNREATDALMATIGEQDVLWNGELFPEVYDAEMYDCPSTRSVRLSCALHTSFDHARTYFLDLMEATDALMATLGEYDALWDGTSFPEIVDAEFYDCPESVGEWSPIFLIPLCLQQDHDLRQVFDRAEALLTLIEVIKYQASVSVHLGAPLHPEGVDAELYDCPLDDQTWYDCYIDLDPPEDWPSVASLK